MAQQPQCRLAFSSGGAAAQHQPVSKMGLFEGDVVAALFGNPHRFGGFPHRVVVGEQRPAQHAEAVSQADKRQQHHRIRIDRALHGDTASDVVAPVLTTQAASRQSAIEQRNCQR